MVKDEKIKQKAYIKSISSNWLMIEINTGINAIIISCQPLYNSLSHKVLIIMHDKTDVAPNIIKYNHETVFAYYVT